MFRTSNSFARRAAALATSSAKSTQASSIPFARASRTFHSTAVNMGGIHEDVDFKRFEQLVLKDGGAETETVLVDFFATWCQPCKLLAPTLHKLAKDEALDVSLVSVDVDKNQQLAAAFGISAMPTIIAFRKGKPVSQFKGLLPEAKVREFIGAVKNAPLQ